MNTITVTIGRNVGDEPMSPSSWNNFIFDTRKAFLQSAEDVWAGALYTGGWNGHSEDAYILYGPSKSESAAAVTILRQTLAILATKYGQDAIGLSVGEGELVESFSDSPSELS